MNKTARSTFGHKERLLRLSRPRPLPDTYRAVLMVALAKTRPRTTLFSTVSETFVMSLVVFETEGWR